MEEFRNRLGRLQEQRHHLLLLALIALALIVRVVFLNGRWINPDEGAHLMDGLLVHWGFVPEVDYHSRQVFYTYVVGAVLRVVGVSYEAARLYPVVATLAIGVLTYLIAGRLFDRRVALLAAAIYLFLPFTIVFGTHVKTEPLTILLSCLGLYAILVGLDRGQSVGLFLLAGVCFGLAYYARQSSLALLLASVIVFIVVLRRPRPVLRASAGVFGGFVAVSVGVLGLYSTALPISEALAHGSLNPAAFVVRTAQPIWHGAAGEPAVVQDVPEQAERATARQLGEHRVDRLRGSSQAWSTTVRNVRRTANLNSVLFVGLFLSPFFLFAGRYAPFRRRQEDVLRAATVLYAWLGAVALAYAFYAVMRGFFPAYFGELLPPLSILAAVVAVDALGRLRSGGRTGLRDVLVFGALLLAVVLPHVVLGGFGINRPFYFLVVPPVLALIYLEGPISRRHWAAVPVLAAAGVAVLLLDGVVRGMVQSLLYVCVLLLLVFGTVFFTWRLDPRREPARAGAFVGYALLVSTCLLWVRPAMAELRRDFDGTWSPETVSEVVSYLEEHTEPGDEVVSGAVIWEFQAKRPPFMLLSHPLVFLGGMPPDQQRSIEERLRELPPAVIILDGYTERTYGANVPTFDELLESRYRLERVIEGSRFPVQIYRLQASGEVAPL